MTHKNTSILISSLLVTSAVGMIAIMYLVFFDGRSINKPISLNTRYDQTLVDKKEYNVGDTIKVKIDYCKYRDIDGAWSWSLVDGIKVDFTPVPINLKNGCHVTWVAIGTVPAIAAHTPDVHIEGQGVYRFNRFSAVSFAITSQTFSIK
jgi:hypothetical protein